MSVNEVWAFLEQRNGKLHGTASSIAAEVRRDSRIFDGAVPCGVYFGPPSLLRELRNLGVYGLEKIYCIEHGGPYTPAAIAAGISEVFGREGPTAALFAATPTASEVAGRLAARVGIGFISQCVDFELRKGVLVARKPIYMDKASGYFAWKQGPPCIATIHLDSLEAAEAGENVEPMIVLERYQETGLKTEFLKRWKVPLSELELKEARVVIGIGGGLDKKEFMDEIYSLAEYLEAVVGGSRVAVFLNYVPLDRQIGATGSFIDADIYIPIGISGSSRHTVAIKDVKHVIPINKNKEAPIFKFAEFGVVGDLYELVPAIIEYIRKIRRIVSEDESRHMP